jgi:ribonuclease P protein component
MDVQGNCMFCSLTLSQQNMNIGIRKYTFGKNEKLTGRKLTSQLFAEGKSFFIPPVKVLWLDTVLNSPAPVQLLISVPRRQFKKAVERNRIRRLFREAYRLHKRAFLEGLDKQGLQCAIALVITGKTAPDFNEAERIIILILQRLQLEHEKTAGKNTDRID